VGLDTRRGYYKQFEQNSHETGAFKPESAGTSEFDAVSHSAGYRSAGLHGAGSYDAEYHKSAADSVCRCDGYDSQIQKIGVAAV
jgi:hypothetical protein